MCAPVTAIADDSDGGDAAVNGTPELKQRCGLQNAAFGRAAAETAGAASSAERPWDFPKLRCTELYAVGNAAPGDSDGNEAGDGEGKVRGDAIGVLVGVRWLAAVSV